MLPFQMPGAGLSDPQPRMPGAPPPAGKGMPQGAMQPPMPGGMAGLPIPGGAGGPPPLPGSPQDQGMGQGMPPMPQGAPQIPQGMPGAGGPGGDIDHDAMRKQMMAAGPGGPPPGMSPPPMNLPAPPAPGGMGQGGPGGMPGGMGQGMPPMPQMPPMGGQVLPSMADLLAPGFPKPGGMR